MCSVSSSCACFYYSRTYDREINNVLGKMCVLTVHKVLPFVILIAAEMDFPEHNKPEFTSVSIIQIRQLQVHEPTCISTSIN